MTSLRPPHWDGSRNLHDLGGRKLASGKRTRHGIVFRSGAHEWLTADGWSAARSDGLRRVIDLRNAREAGRRPEHPAIGGSAMAGIEIMRRPTEDPDDPVYLAECGQWLDHPRSWAPNLALYPDKFAAVFSAIAASPGPVLIHCAGGRDRTGLVCAMLLTMAGATADEICADYETGFRGAAEHRGHGMVLDADTGQWTTAQDKKWSSAELDDAMADRLPTLREWIASTDVPGYLVDIGLDEDELKTLAGLLQ